MGYRSQVACCISVDTVQETGKDENGNPYTKYTYDKDKFKQMVGFIKLSKFWDLWHTEESAFGWADGKFIMYGEAWKWYPDYADVQAFHEMFNQLSDIEGISGYFMRVGEESGDIEEDSFGDDPCYDYFHSYSAMSFSGEEYLGKRITDEEEQNAQSENVA